MRGLNLPATQGTSNAGNFLPGVYQFDYTAEDLDKVRQKRFDSLRLPVNTATAGDHQSLKALQAYFAAVGGQGILCLWESTTDPQARPHGSGRANVTAVSCAWSQAHDVFTDSSVLYEIFNEPFGYTTPQEYLHDMLLIMHHAQLPFSRCILDGVGYADDVRALDRLGWQGLVAYHFYPNWLPEGQRTEDAYAAKIVQDLSEVQDRAFITEFGANLNLSDKKQADSTVDDDRQCLLGLAKAIRQLPKLQGAFHYHGWHNSDTYDFWDDKNQAGAELVLAALDCLGIEKLRSQPLALFRKNEMSYLILLSDARFPQMAHWGWTFERIACQCWPEGQSPDLEPVKCFRKDELAVYCVADFEALAIADGFVFESVAFYALRPDSKLADTMAVHEWRKEDMTYYAREDSEWFDRLPAWGWTKQRIAFRVLSN